MKSYRLIYKSVATAEVVSNETLRHLEQQSSAANAAKGINGLLVLAGNVFLQVLEGPAREVTELFGRIMNDKRHRQVELVTFEPVVEPCFDDWSMRLVDLYDLPGEKRALMKAKYQEKNGSIVVPTEIHEVHALLFDARYLCQSAPWNRATGESGQDEAANSVPR